MQSDLERFYELLEALSAQPHQGLPLQACTGRFAWPARGVYFFTEPGEFRTGAHGVRRVVRVGTHAVSANSRSTLWQRLRAHRGGRDGGGNHRGSIFRLHVGAALLQATRSQLATWGQGSSAPRAIRDAEIDHEKRVSAVVGAMSVFWLDVPDEPGPNSARAVIERNAIALLSQQFEPADAPSQGWLGLSSPRTEIRRSGLWNLNYVNAAYDPAFLDRMASYLPEGGR